MNGVNFKHLNSYRFACVCLRGSHMKSSSYKVSLEKPSGLWCSPSTTALTLTTRSLSTHIGLSPSNTPLRLSSFLILPFHQDVGVFSPVFLKVFSRTPISHISKPSLELPWTDNCFKLCYSLFFKPTRWQIRLSKALALTAEFYSSGHLTYSYH